VRGIFLAEKQEKSAKMGARKEFFVANAGISRKNPKESLYARFSPFLSAKIESASPFGDADSLL
jgi:hypothetical protein